MIQPNSWYYVGLCLVELRKTTKKKP